MLIDDQQSITKTIQSFFEAFPSTHVLKDQTIIDSNQQPQGVLYLISGKVRVYALTSSGNEWTLNTFKSGAFFPMSWAINNTPNTYCYEATENSVYKMAPKDDVLYFIYNHPPVLYDLLKRVYLGTDGLLLRMSYLLQDNSYASLIVELLIDAKRFGKPIHDNQGMELVINQQAVASQAGMSRETVSREMALLKRKGLINFTHHLLTIPSIKGLEDELSQLS